MRTLKLTIEYDGTNYAGWQIQDNALTIQECIESALAQMTGKHHRVNGAGRTDSGVHAKAQVAHFSTTSKIVCRSFQAGLNGLLPSDIAIKKVEEVARDFHARFAARAKIYRYTIYNNHIRSPLLHPYSWWVSYALDIPAMRKAARVLVGTHDFKAFQARDKRERPSVKTIEKIRITTDKSMVYIDIKADGFLYNMARSIVGTLVEIGRGKYSTGSMNDIIEQKDRSLVGQTAPGCGLCLERVFY